MKIDVFIEDKISSELSGNMIDLCPVGALNNKPYRYKARTWDLREKAGISPHDCIGSNIFYHTYKNKILRAIPKENPGINQTWLSDRDRFGYEGIYSEDRIFKSYIRENKKLIELDKQLVVNEVTKSLKKSIEGYSTNNIGCMISARSTNEELYLFQKLLRGLGLNNIDHRTNECDFSYQDSYPIMPSLGCNIDNLKDFDNIVLIGVNIKSEFPILSIWLNEATKNNTKIYSINFDSSDEDFDLSYKKVINNNELVSFFLEEKHNLDFNKNEKTIVINGPSISRLFNQSDILSVIHKFCIKIKSKMGFLTDYCNSTGAWASGNVPHRLTGGDTFDKPGLNAHEMLSKKLPSYILFNLEPELDFHDSKLLECALKESKNNIIFTNYMTPMIEKYADIVIPISTFAETKGSFINIEGKEQSFQPIVDCNKNIFEGWDILNQLMTANSISSYDYDSIRSQLINSLDNIDYTKMGFSKNKLIKDYGTDNNIFILSKRHIYKSDSIVKRSGSLKMTPQSKSNSILISKNLENQINNSNFISKNNFDINKIMKRLIVDNKLSDNTIIFPSSDHDDQCNNPKSINLELQS